MPRPQLRVSTVRSKTAHAVALGGLLGLGAALVGFGVTESVRLRTDDVTVPLVAGIPFELYAILGCIAVGGLVAYLYERYRTAAPAVVVTLVYLLALGWTRWRIHVWEGPSGPRTLIPPQPPWVTVYEYVVLGWPLLLAGAVLVGILERAFGPAGER